MVNNYKILRKARLADDLFRGDDDGAAWEQDQADREWARTLDADPGEARATTLLPDPQRRGEAILELADTPEPEEVRALAPAPRAPAPRPARSWAQMLADLTGNPVLEGIRTLGVCALDRETDASSAIAGLAEWMAQHSDTPALTVEAHFGEARLGRAFHARDSGLKETLLQKEPVDNLIQETPAPNLKLLAGGGDLSGREKREALRELPVLLTSLRERYQTILVELPAVDDPAFDKLQISALADAMILVADSRTAEPLKLRRAADKLLHGRTTLAATLLDSTQTVGAQPASRVWSPRMTGRG